MRREDWFHPEAVRDRRLDRVRRAIALYRRKHGVGPTHREVAYDAGLTVSEVGNVLAELRDRDLVTWNHGVPRSLRLVEE